MLRVCKRAYCLLDDSRVIDHVASIGPETIDLLSLYDPVLTRPEIYDRIAEVLVSSASGSTKPVALVTHGHPLFLVSASERILERAKTCGITTQVISGVSSFDTLLTDLQIDLGYGFQAFDATTLVIEDHPINPHLPTLIFQAANTLCITPQFGAPQPELLRPLFRKLRKHYQENQIITFVHSRTHLLQNSEICSIALSDEANLASVKLWKRPTIYIAPQ